MSKGLLKSRKVKLKLSEKSIRVPSFDNVQKYKNYRKIYNSLIKHAKKKYFETALEKNKNDLRKTWDILRSAMGRSNDKSCIIDEIKLDGNSFTSDMEIASSLNDYFTSIADEITAKINPTTIDPLCTIQNSDNHFRFEAITSPQLNNIVKKMDSKKSKDMFNMSNQLLKKIFSAIAVPFSHIINLSLSSGLVPTQMKKAKVIPIYKRKGDKTSPTNYRPISLLPILSKILEKVVANQLTRYLDSNELLYKHQYGFQSGKGTIHPVVHLINEIGKAKNEDKVAVGVFCDISKGFDTISHSILLSKLEKIGIKDVELEWFKNYLYQREQFVEINGSYSNNKPINRGVPQGSILGPILFLIYINDLPNVTELLTLLFADDSSFLISGKTLSEVIAKLNMELKKICDWFRTNEMSLHPDKTKFMIFNKREDSIDWNETRVVLNFNNGDENDLNLITKLEYVNSKSDEPAIKFLGIFIDPQLTFRYHIQHIQRKVSSSLYVIKCLRNYLGENALKTLYHSFIHSHLLYCLPIWSSGLASSLNPLILIQKKAIRTITGKRYNAHTAPLFKKLNILPLSQLSTLSKLTFVYDYINNRLPPSFNSLWVKNSDRNPRNLRNSDKFFIPTVKFKGIERFPAYHFQKLWNELCDNDLLNARLPRKCFVKNLKAYLMLEVETICNNHRCPECSQN